MAASKIPFKKVCEWCGQEFYAKKVTTRYCCKKCNEHAYKAKLRHTQIQLVAQEYKETVLDKPIKYLQEKPYLTVKETAAVLGLTRMTVYNLIYSGMLTAARISSRLTLIKREDIDSMLSSNPYSKRQKPKDEPITEFYTTTDFPQGEVRCFKQLDIQGRQGEEHSEDFPDGKHILEQVPYRKSHCRSSTG